MRSGHPYAQVAVGISSALEISIQFISEAEVLASFAPSLATRDASNGMFPKCADPFICVHSLPKLPGLSVC